MYEGVIFSGGFFLIINDFDFNYTMQEIFMHPLISAERWLNFRVVYAYLHILQRITMGRFIWCADNKESSSFAETVFMIPFIYFFCLFLFF